jgi:hypothetical protein
LIQIDPSLPPYRFSVGEVIAVIGGIVGGLLVLVNLLNGLRGMSAVKRRELDERILGLMSNFCSTKHESISKEKELRINNLIATMTEETRKHEEAARELRRETAETARILAEKTRDTAATLAEVVKNATNGITSSIDGLREEMRTGLLEVNRRVDKVLTKDRE